MTTPRHDRRIVPRPIAICVLAAACASGGGCVSPTGDWLYRKTGIDLSPQAFEQAAEDVGEAFEVVLVLALWLAYGFAACNSGVGWSVSGGSLHIGDTPARSYYPTYVVDYWDADSTRWRSWRSDPQ